MSWRPSEDDETDVGFQLLWFFTEEFDDCCSGVPEIFGDQWWVARHKCEHGSYRGVSNGPLDLWRALDRLRHRIKEAHHELAEVGSTGPDR